MSPRRALDWLNFSLADVRGCLGPYVGIFLLTQEHWSAASIGLVTTVTAVAGMALNAPAGAFIDATHFKRGSILVGLIVLAVSAVAMALRPTVSIVLMSNTAMAVAGDLFGPAVAAITLGVLGTRRLATQLGRNAALDHAGNVFIAVAAGFVGSWVSQRAVFLLVPCFAALSGVAVLAIPARAIDYTRARGLAAERSDRAAPPSGWMALLECRPLLVFTACIALFHFANAPMLPLVGQKLALAHAGEETALMSACIVAAQVVMFPMALLVAAKADTWGRKPLFLIAFAILPIRSVLYTLSDDRLWLVAVQLLDGIGAGIFGALTPLVLADLTRGSGRFNVSQGIVATVQGVGASLSSTLAGVSVVTLGYNVTFISLASVALLAALVFLFVMPETARTRSGPWTGPAQGSSRRTVKLQGTQQGARPRKCGTRC